MLIQACLNGNRAVGTHPSLPTRPEELAREARAAVAAGARSLHIHPRGHDGAETLAAEPCAVVLSVLRRACSGVPIGFSTGAWIEPDLGRRLTLLDGWRSKPDFASVNFAEDGAIVVAERLLGLGISLEAGLATVDDAERLLASGLEPRCQRILIEVEPPDDPARAVATARDIDRVLERASARTPCLHHGYGRATWAVLAAAVPRHDVRIGLEDTLVLPDGSPARDNAALVSEAVRLVRTRGTPLCLYRAERNG